jgi:hypothetical protein
MVNKFTLKKSVINDTHSQLVKDFFICVRDRTVEFQVPRCWILKDPHDKGGIYLPRQFFNERRGRQVQIRQVLFQLFYQTPPPLGRALQMACEHKLCQNPLHVKIRGWQAPWPIVEAYIGLFISRSDAEQYHQVTGGD